MSMDDIFDMNRMSDGDLVSDGTLLTALSRMPSKHINESEFVSNHRIEAVDRNDQLLLIITRLFKRGTLLVFWSGTKSDRTYFIVDTDSGKAYTKRYKEREPSIPSSESGPE